MQKIHQSKLQGYWITFIAYATIHALRMCYSFNKVNLKRQFQLSQFFLGILDAILYLSYGLGVFLRYEIFQGNQSINKVYFITSMLISCAFGSIAYIGLFREQGYLDGNWPKLLLTVGVVGFGFFQLAVYQICGSIVSGYYDSNQQSHKIGFWGANSSVGNIAGFFVSNVITHQLNLKWEVTFMLFAIINLLMAFVVYFLLQVPQQDQTYKLKLYQISTKRQSKLHGQNDEQENQIRVIHWLTFIKQTFTASFQARYTYLAYITIKATVYTFLMWFPIFLVSKNLQTVSGYVSTLFDVGGTIGGYLIGRLHQINYEKENKNEAIQQSTGIVACMLKYRNVIFISVIVAMIVLFLVVDGSLLVYCPLTLLMGFFLGGTFNNISSHEIFKIAENRVLLTDMLLNLSVGISCLMIGVVQLVTAFLLKFNNQEIKKDKKENYGVIFLVLLILMCVSGFIMLKRVFLVQEKRLMKINSGKQITSEIDD